MAARPSLNRTLIPAKAGVEFWFTAVAAKLAHRVRGDDAVYPTQPPSTDQPHKGESDATD